MSSEFLELRGISKFYGNIIALKGVTTTVNPGEVTCVLGDNGLWSTRSKVPSCAPPHRPSPTGSTSR